jgi:hypothetical protein
MMTRHERSRQAQWSEQNVRFGTYEKKLMAVSSHQFIVQKMTGEGRVNRCIEFSRLA